jgi:group I intron endonuclease
MRAIKKYGVDCWSKEILEEVDNIDILNEREMYWINHYNTYNKGYNSTTGGENGYIFTDDVKKKISKSMSRKRKPLSEETKRKMSEVRKGRIFSEEHKRKLSESKIGNTLSKGRKQTEETKKKISEANKGKKHKNKRVYKKHSDETKLKISKAKKGRKHKNKRVYKKDIVNLL